MFALAAPGRLQELLQAAGFLEVVVEQVQVERRHRSVQDYVEETLDLSRPLAEIWDGLAEDERDVVVDRIASLAQPYTEGKGSLRLSGRSLVAAASA